MMLGLSLSLGRGLAVPGLGLDTQGLGLAVPGFGLVPCGLVNITASPSVLRVSPLGTQPQLE